jgi:DNA-nicking Smr family endonuclease
MSNLSDEDKALFRKAVGDAIPLNQEKTSPLPAPSKPIQKQTTSPLEYTTQPLYLSDTTLFTLQGETPVFYSQSALSRATLQPFKRGQYPIEGQLDLHGMTANQAKEALMDFILKHHQLKHRVLLIVHGKGRHTDQPILKNLVNHWLPQFPQVLAFVSAVPQDGGTGAMYVLLKRNSLT